MAVLAANDRAMTSRRHFSVFSVAFEVTRQNNLCPKTIWSELEPVSTFQPFTVKQHDLTFEEVVCILKKIENSGTPSVLLQGGEFFLRDDSLEILREARKRFLTEVLTNATLINDEICETIRKLNVDVIAYAPSFSKQLYESLNQRPGAYSRLITGIRRLVDSEVKLIFLVPVTRPLVRNIEETVTTIRNCGGRVIKFTLYPGSGYGHKFRRELSLSRLESLEAIYKIERLREIHNSNLKVYHSFVAPYVPNDACFGSYAIDSHGNVMPCAYLRIAYGNILKENVSKIHRRITREVFNEAGGEVGPPAECSGCGIVSPLTGAPCKGGCRCLAYNLYGDLGGPDWGCPYLSLRLLRGEKNRASLFRGKSNSSNPTH